MASDEGKQWTKESYLAHLAELQNKQREEVNPHMADKPRAEDKNYYLGGPEGKDRKEGKDTPEDQAEAGVAVEGWISGDYSGGDGGGGG